MSVIGPALEVFLTAVGLVLLALIGLGLLIRPFWPRIVTYFRRWYERDMRLEQQQREEAECRRKAQQEMREYCHDDILQSAVPAAQESGVQESSTQHPIQNGFAQAVPIQEVPIQEIPVQATSIQAVPFPVEAESVQRIGLERQGNEA